MTAILHITGFFGTFVNPIGLQNLGWKYYIVYIVYTFIEVCACAFPLPLKRTDFPDSWLLSGTSSWRLEASLLSRSVRSLTQKVSAGSSAAT
jgi:hypothetical protein